MLCNIAVDMIRRLNAVGIAIDDSNFFVSPAVEGGLDIDLRTSKGLVFIGMRNSGISEISCSWADTDRETSLEDTHQAVLEEICFR